MTNRDSEIEATLGAQRQALESIAQESCGYEDVPEKEVPFPCPCPRHVARRALKLGRSWRFDGARPERLHTSPREKKLVDAMRERLDDGVFAALLSTDTRKDEAAPRDWFVAATIIQWLGTNVGMELLRKAGWEYKGWDEDRPMIDQLVAGTFKPKED